ncbi:MAG: SH3 domain-containing protein, partial [Anaerolineae bacterium]|nr:SH3 domain-containing protein [Anaerolineae bacterium]
GWTYFGSCISLSHDFGVLPVLDPAQLQGGVAIGPPVASVLCTQYLRDAPSTNGGALLILTGADAPLSIGGRTADNNWMLVTTVNGVVGWTAYTDCLSVQGSFLEVPVVQSGTTYSGPPVLDPLCTQYVRAQPSVEAPRVAIMYATDEYWTIEGRNRAGTWLLVRNADGDLGGWTARGDCVRVLGDYNAVPTVAETTVIGDPYIQISCSQYMRALPAPDAQRVAVLNPIDGPLDVLGRTVDGSWVYVTRDDGVSGWTANAACVSVTGDVFAAPVFFSGDGGEVAAPEGPPQATLLCGQYLREEAAADAPRTGLMNPGDGPFMVVGRTGNNDWLYLTDFGGVTGWAAWGDCLNVQGDVASLPVLSGVYTGPAVADLVCNQFLRAAPAADAEQLYVLPVAGGPYLILGRNAESTWLYLLLDNGMQGWAAWGDCLTVQGNAYSVPVVVDGGFSGQAEASVLCSQYLRVLPEDGAQTVAIVNGVEGTLAITGRTSAGDWMQITLEDGTVGWAATGICLGVRGDFEAVPVVDLSGPGYSGPPLATVTCPQNLRALPDGDSEVVAIVDSVGAAVSVIGRSADNNWMQVELDDGTIGWAAVGVCLNVRGSLTAAPVVTVEEPVYTGPAIATVHCSQYLRSGPGADYADVYVLNATDGVMAVLSRTADATWLYLRLANATEGWAANSGECLAVQGDVFAVPVQDEETYSGPPIADLVCNVNFRRTPTSGGTIMAVVPADSGTFNVLARDAAASWLLLEGPDGMVGWVAYSNCVSTLGAVLQAPVPSTVPDQSLWTVLQAAGPCEAGDQAGAIIGDYNRTAPVGPVSRVCMSSEEALLALAQFDVELAVLPESCPGFQQVQLSGGQYLCYRAVHTSQVDFFAEYASQR